MSSSSTAQDWLASSSFLLAGFLVAVGAIYERFLRILVERDVSKSVTDISLLPGAVQPQGVADRVIWGVELAQILALPSAAVAGGLAAIPSNTNPIVGWVYLTVLVLGSLLFAWAASQGAVRYLARRRFLFTPIGGLSLVVNVAAVVAIHIID